MSKSVEEVCERCGRTTLVFVGDGSVYVPIALCDECTHEINRKKRKFYDGIC